MGVGAAPWTLVLGLAEEVEESFIESVLTLYLHYLATQVPVNQVIEM